MMTKYTAWSTSTTGRCWPITRSTVKYIERRKMMPIIGIGEQLICVGGERGKLLFHK